VAIAVATAMTGQVNYLGIDRKTGRTNLETRMAEWEQRLGFVRTPLAKGWVAKVDTHVSSNI